MKCYTKSGDCEHQEQNLMTQEEQWGAGLQRWLQDARLEAGLVVGDTVLFISPTGV